MPVILITPFKSHPLGAPTGWTSIAAPGNVGGFSASGLLGDNRLIISGYLGTQILDTSSFTWSAGTTITTTSTYRRGVVHPNGNFYTGMGCCAGDGTTFAFFRYNYLTDTWTTLTSAPSITSRYFAYAIAYGGASNNIYTFGGADAAYNTKIYEYDVAGNSWADTGTALPVVMVQHEAITLNDGKILVGGGTGSQQKFYIYDADLNNLTAVSDFPTTEANEALMTLLDNGNPYFVAGHTTNGSTSTNAYEYNVSLDTWIERTDLSASNGWNTNSAFCEKLSDGRIVVGNNIVAYVSTA